MLVWMVIIFAILQGIIEWLPISSQGQLMVLQSFLGVDPKLAFSLIFWLHLGTLMSVLVKYRREIRVYLDYKNRDEIINKWRVFILLSLLGTILVGIPCFFIVKKLALDETFGQYISLLIGIALIITAFILYKTGKQNKEMRELTSLPKKHMLLAGMLQGFAIIPGISRSGITMSGLLFLGVKKEEAIKGSFLMSIPAVIGGFTLDLLISLIEQEPLFIIEAWKLGIAIIISAIFGFITIDLFLRITQKYNFAIVCVILAIIIIGTFVITIII